MASITRRMLLGSSASLGLPLSAQTTWVVQFDPASVPTMYADEQGQARGIYPALVAAAFARLGEPLQAGTLPFRRLVNELREGRSLAGAVIRTPEREAFADFSHPYFSEALTVLTQGERAPGMPNWAALKRGRIGVIRGWSYGPGFEAARQTQELRTEEVTSDLNNLLMLLRKRLDAVLITELGARYLQLRHPELQALAPAFRLNANDIHLAVPRGQPGGPQLLERFNSAVAALRRSGELERLAEQALQQAATRG
ncbi:substrate-binding periplasmic protein [Inhella sp.]|uniref:substrate-binding periplasmic protein n=1 Tax=Inhella sp. TaxID=1921806 RepID=UPI0035AFA429